MSAHPSDTAAEASNAPANAGDAVEDFADFLEATEGGEEEDEEFSDAEEADDDALEADEAEDATQDESDEPDEPAIDPPVSWGNDAKELFAQLPADLQKQVVEREAQRERFVQQKSTEASEAKRTARIEAETAFADTQRQYASELEQYANLLAPQRPNPALVQHDPALFYAQMAQYEQATAQHQDMMQRAAYARHEAQQREAAAQAEAWEADMAVLAQQVPDWNDEAKRNAFLTEVVNIGGELGYTPEAMKQANASDILALRRAAEWKSKATKYDALQKTKMEKVRGAKKLPKVVRPGVAPTRGEIDSNRSQAAWQRVKTSRSKEAQAEAFADFLESSGHRLT